jgi:fused signal recognition particle receptor
MSLLQRLRLAGTDAIERLLQGRVDQVVRMLDSPLSQRLVRGELLEICQQDAVRASAKTHKQRSFGRLVLPTCLVREGEHRIHDIGRGLGGEQILQGGGAHLEVASLAESTPERAEPRAEFLGGSLVERAAVHAQRTAQATHSRTGLVHRILAAQFHRYQLLGELCGEAGEGEHAHTVTTRLVNMAERTPWSLSNALRGMFAKKTIDDTTWDDLETALITADFGPDVTEAIVDDLRAKVERYRTTDPADLQRMLRESLEERLSKLDTTLKLSERPAVILVVGVNGVGKTTTIGKFAKFLRTYDRTVVVGAADTFRAAAVEQLATWAERAGAQIVRPQQQGQDPASVAFQTVELAKQNGIEVVIIDTAGRLQTKGGLMDELSKIKRVVEKQAPISEVLLVLDATTGQNGLAQAEAFIEHAGVTGLVLTKLDGSAKGGFVLAVQEKTGIPIKLVGQGEGINDLTGFTAHVFAQQLVG